MGKLGKIALGAVIGVGAVAVAPFTGGGSLLGGATLLGSLAGSAVIATAAGLAGATSGAIVEKVEEKKKEESILHEKENAFKDGVKAGKVLTVEEIKKHADFYLATAALSYFIARCDGSISPEEQAEIDVDLDAIYKNKDIPKSLKNELYIIANNVNISFKDVKKYLDKISLETIEQLKSDIDEIAYACDGINEDELFAKSQFENYVAGRKK